MFHRIDDLGAMPAMRFVRLVERLWAYPGLVGETYAEQYPAAGVTEPRAGDSVEVVEATPEVLSSHPAFAGLVSFGRG